MKHDHLIINATIVDKQGFEKKQQAIAIHQGKIQWCGSMDSLTEDYHPEQAAAVIDWENQLVTPGLIDCHTHLIYGGNRADEFKLRLEGVSYTEIAQRGGGILSTVRHTRAASEEELLQQTLPRLQALMADGVTTVEIKSGYGLDLANEIKMLRVARRLGEITGMRVVTTFLGAHATPPEFKGEPQAYVDYLCTEVLPEVAKQHLADAVDVFCESIGFSLAQTRQLFEAAQRYGLPVKCHAEQLSNLGASQLVAEFNGCSSDHVEHLDTTGIQAMAEAKVVAVLLPGAYYFLRETKKPPIDALRTAGVGMALATDCNPGTSPTTSLRLMMNMGCQLFGLTVPEAMSAVTYQAARALKVEHLVGSIEAGRMADLVFWSCKDSAELCYSFGYPLAHRMMIAGKFMAV